MRTGVNRRGAGSGSKGGSQVCIKMRTTVNTPRLPRYTPPFTSVHTLAGGASVTRRNGVGAMMPRHVVVHSESRRRARRLLHGPDPRSWWPGARRWWWPGARRWWWWCPYGGWWQLRWRTRRGNVAAHPRGGGGTGVVGDRSGRLLHRAGAASCAEAWPTPDTSPGCFHDAAARRVCVVRFDAAATPEAETPNRDHRSPSRGLSL